ncbi:hypothetical protein FRC12_022989 [Ceratobasidium sp. 428]|nr:hypothetical protein FRC12_022989 [Ceratobasidium sp. 428]
MDFNTTFCTIPGFVPWTIQYLGYDTLKHATIRLRHLMRIRYLFGIPLLLYSTSPTSMGSDDPTVDARLAELCAQLRRKVASTVEDLQPAEMTASGVTPGQALYDSPPSGVPEPPALERAGRKRKRTSSGQEYDNKREADKVTAAKSRATRERNARSRSAHSEPRNAIEPDSIPIDQDGQPGPSAAETDPDTQPLGSQSQWVDRIITRDEIIHDLQPWYPNLNLSTMSIEELQRLVFRFAEEFKAMKAASAKTGVDPEPPQAPQPDEDEDDLAEQAEQMLLDQPSQGEPGDYMVQGSSSSSAQPAVRPDWSWAPPSAPPTEPSARPRPRPRAKPQTPGPAQSPASARVNSTPAAVPTPAPASAPAPAPAPDSAEAPEASKRSESPDTATQLETDDDDLAPPPIKRSRTRQLPAAAASPPESKASSEVESNHVPTPPLPLQLRYPPSQPPESPRQPPPVTEVVPETESDVINERIPHPRPATYTGARSHVRSGNPLNPKSNSQCVTSWRDGVHAHPPLNLSSGPKLARRLAVPDCEHESERTQRKATLAAEREAAKSTLHEMIVPADPVQDARDDMIVQKHEKLKKLATSFVGPEEEKKKKKKKKKPKKKAHRGDREEDGNKSASDRSTSHSGSRSQSEVEDEDKRVQGDEREALRHGERVLTKTGRT